MCKSSQYRPNFKLIIYQLQIGLHNFYVRLISINEADGAYIYQ
jgi:hypothetical protein